MFLALLARGKLIGTDHIIIRTDTKKFPSKRFSVDPFSISIEHLTEFITRPKTNLYARIAPN